MTPTPLEHTHRFCPRCGTQNGNPPATPFRCAECNFTNFFGPVLAVGSLIVNQAGELLLVTRAREPGKGKWGLPGGFVDSGENAEQAAAREIHEEVGLTINSFEYLLSRPNEYDYHGVISPVIDLFFTAAAPQPATIRLAASELDSYVWTIPTQEHLDAMAFESNRLAIEFWLAHRT